MNYETYELPRTTQYPLSFLVILFITIFSYYLIFLTIFDLYPQYKKNFLPIQFLINLAFIWFSIRALSKNTKNIIFSKIKVNLNLENKDINFSQRKEIIKQNPDGFNFYATLTVKNHSNLKKIKNDLEKKINKIFIILIYDSTFDSVMAKEHWNHLAFVTFLYFIYLIILIETIGIGKKNFEIYQNESFFIIIFLTIISSVINEYLQLKTHEKAIILTFIMGILILSFVQDVKLNQTYSITLMLISLLTLIYIAYLPISLIKPNSQRSTVKKDNLDKHFLIDIYFNRTFLYYSNTHLEPSKNMRKEIFL